MLFLFLLNNFFIKIYKIYLFIHKHLEKILDPIKDWVFSPFSGRFIIHIVVIIISFLVVFDNINAQETREDETSLKLKNNIVYKISSDVNLELIEEKASNKLVMPVFSYLEPEISKPYVSDQDRIDALLAEQNEETMLAGEDSLMKPSLTSTITNLKLRDQIEQYTVISGDTISGIAEKFGLNVTTLLWANNLTVRSYIKPGDTLTIPPINGVIHTVKKGDTLAKIATTYDAETDKILEFNRLVAANEIQIGQELMIPGGEKPAPVIQRPVASSPAASSPATNYVSTTPTYTNSSSDTQLLWPTDWHVITQYYNWRHTGLDLDGDYSSRIFASEDGVVIKAQGGWNGGYGLYIIIDHGGGMQTLYAHNSKLFVKPGDHVKRGQVIAMMGSTGRSTGSHLHYEVRVNGSRLNPLRYIR